MSVHLHTSLTLSFYVLVCCLFGPRKSSSAPKEQLTSSDLLSLSLSLSIFPFTCLHISIQFHTSLIHLFTLFFMFSCVASPGPETGGSGPEWPRKTSSGPEREVQAAKDKFGFAINIYIYISFSVRFFSLRISIHLFTVFSYDLLLCLLGMVQDGPRVKILVTTLLYYAIPLLFFSVAVSF